MQVKRFAKAVGASRSTSRGLIQIRSVATAMRASAAEIGAKSKVNPRLITAALPWQLEDTTSSATEGSCKLSKNKTRATTPRNYKPDKIELCKRIPIFPCISFH